MIKKQIHILIAVTITMIQFFIAGCSAKHAVVLMPDPDGHIGKAEVVTDGGLQLLQKAGDMTCVSGRSNPPAAITTADPNYITVTFAEALAIQPIPPEKFILFFETGGNNLVPESQAAITDILTAIKRRSSVSIIVSGHTDAVGSAQLNDSLANSRAQLIRDILIRNGVNEERLIVTSHGKGNPLVVTPDGVAEPRNRRVEVVVR